MTTRKKTTPVPVTFSLPAEVDADNVNLCGEFNDWAQADLALHRTEDGSWQLMIDLLPGHNYRYRYLLDGQRWENAWFADDYLPNPYGSDDSVVAVGLPNGHKAAHRQGKAIAAPG